MLERLFKKCLISDSNIVIQILVLLVQCLVPFRNKKKITALIYHRVSNKPAEFDELSVPVEIFDWQMRLVAKLFNVISLDQALEFLEGGSVPSRAVVITFDDGYLDNYTKALPLLQKYNACATLYLVIDRHNNDWSIKKNPKHFFFIFVILNPQIVTYPILVVFAPFKRQNIEIYSKFL